MPPIYDHKPTHARRAIRTEPGGRGRGAEGMMVTPTSAFAERGFQTDLVLAEARRPYPGRVAPRVRSAGAKRADLEASASELGVADSVSLPGFSTLSAATPASLTAPAGPALRAGALDFSEEKIIPQYLEVWLARQGAADGQPSADRSAPARVRPETPARPL